MLMETALVITMTGLMTHVGDKAADANVRKSVAIVLGRDQGHKPRLLVRKCFRTDVAQDFSHELRPGDRVSFDSGVTKGFATASSAFVNFTPSLIEPVTNAIVVGAVRARKPHDKVVAWLDYPQGDLDIAWYHFYEARFVREGQGPASQCVPKGTWFVAPTTGIVQMKIERKDARPIIIPLKQSALVEITNQPHTPSADDEMGSAHFANYAGLLRRRYFILPRKIARVERGEKCGNSPTLIKEPTTHDLAILIGPRVPAIATELTGPCNVDSLILSDNDHPACTNTDWP